jgi:hypothetical protein
MKETLSINVKAGQKRTMGHATMNFSGQYQPTSAYARSRQPSPHLAEVEKGARFPDLHISPGPNNARLKPYAAASSLLASLAVIFSGS